MAKSIHERVRAQLEKQAREAKRVEDRAHDRKMRADEKHDADFERGVEAFDRDGYLPANANEQMKRGFAAASRSEFGYDE